MALIQETNPKTKKRTPMIPIEIQVSFWLNDSAFTATDDEGIVLLGWEKGERRALKVDGRQKTEDGRRVPKNAYLPVGREDR
jgi:hypothetical protein